MKKFLTGIVLVGAGAGGWWLLSQTAQFSLKKWDAKFGSVIRQGLDDVGLSNQDIVSSVNEIKKDSHGQWVTAHITLKLNDSNKQKILKDKLEAAGATVVEKTHDAKSSTLQVMRGHRTYQEITFIKP